MSHNGVISVIGFHRSTMGLGEDARMLAEACLHIGFIPELVDLSPPSLQPNRNDDRYRVFEARTPTAEIIVFCLPPLEMQRACNLLGNAIKGKHRIGYWQWETSALPPAAVSAFDLVDEVWAPSTFLVDVHRIGGRRPVRLMPLPVTVERPTLTPALAELFDGRFTILSVFDFHSHLARKNPHGAVAAFRRAYPLGTEPVQLILKSINAEHRPEDLARLLSASFEDPRISVVDGTIERAALCGLIACSDIYLSLHRAEGFGRPVAEAMLLSTPVVATRWSGTADFLDEVTGHPISSSLRPVRAEEYPHAAGLWAEPHLGEAAASLAALFANPVARRRTCAAAQQRVVDMFGPDAVDANLRAALSSSLGEAEPLQR